MSKSIDAYFRHILTVGFPKINLMDYSYIPVVKYQDKIKKICENGLSHGISYYSTAIHLNNDTSILLSNNIDACLSYLLYGLNRADTLWQKNSYEIGVDHDFPMLNLQDSLSIQIRQFIAQHFSIYHAYRAIRADADVLIFFACLFAEPITTHENIYEKTIDYLEEMTIDFYDKMIDDCMVELPLLKLTRFATDQDYRHRFIKNRQQSSSYLLPPREIECLFWASRGKSINETAIILGLSSHTIDAYRKSAIKRLEAKNITHAVFIAICHGLLT